MNLLLLKNANGGVKDNDLLSQLVLMCIFAKIGEL